MAWNQRRVIAIVKLVFHWSEMTYAADWLKKNACDCGRGSRKRCCAPMLKPNDHTLALELSDASGNLLKEPSKLNTLSMRERRSEPALGALSRRRRHPRGRRAAHTQSNLANLQRRFAMPDLELPEVATTTADVSRREDAGLSAL